MGFLNNRLFNFYKDYIHKNGPRAIFICRLTLAAPFNIVSYLAGLTQMNIISFSLATILGTIPEAALFTFVGSILKHTRLRLWYIFILAVIIGSAGTILMFLMMKLLQSRFGSKKIDQKALRHL
jgi:uncharacterized membrane protein YdjX (TVP38/TMEM64 family)